MKSATCKQALTKGPNNINIYSIAMKKGCDADGIETVRAHCIERLCIDFKYGITVDQPTATMSSNQGLITAETQKLKHIGNLEN